MQEKDLVLSRLKLQAMLEKNKEQLEVLENEAIDFVNHIYKRYKGKVSAFVVSFSAGKDSQVILDIVSKVIPPEDYIVIFTDTTMEIPPTYEAFEETKRKYRETYPELKFYTARNWKPAEATWKEFGPPSRLLRWCCSVHKSAPMIRLVREIVGRNDGVRIVVFDGVREEESTRRKGYSRLAENVKHFTQINAEVIKRWTTTEVYTYILARELPLIMGRNIFPADNTSKYCKSLSLFNISSILYLYFVETIPVFASAFFSFFKTHSTVLYITVRSHITRSALSLKYWRKRSALESEVSPLSILKASANVSPIVLQILSGEDSG